MVNSSVPTEASRVRREREEENAAVEAPSKKSRHAGKNGGLEGAPDVSGQTTPGKGEDENNGKLEGNAEKGFQESAETVNEGDTPSVDPSAAPAVTPEAASRPEPPAQEVYRIPSYAAWFRWDKIHPLERRGMSEFFDKRSAAKTPRIYKEYRDFIINKYRENPKQALTFNEVRRMLIGDVNSLSRVFDFLEHWGLINQQFSLEQAASEAPSPSPSVIDSFPSGVNVVSMPMVHATKTPGISTFESSGHSPAASHANNLATHKNVFSPARKKLGPGSTVGNKKAGEEAHCHSCKKDCSKQRFYKKQPGFSFCSDCVKNGKLPAGTSASDFVQATDGELTVAAKEWTSKETLLLLEAVSRFGENWNQVAAHVPMRSKSECVKHFIQLPFGDNYDIEPEEPKPSLVAAGGTPTKIAGRVSASTEETVLSDHTAPNGALPSVSTSEAAQDVNADAVAASHDFVSPFTDTSHPLFAQVALLSGMVGPRVAAAAAQAAVAAIAEDEPGVSELPFMQSFKTCSAQKKCASQTMHNHTESLMEESNDGLQSNGEAPSHGEHPTSEKSSVLPNYPDAPKPAAGIEELPSAVQARVSVATALGVAAANAKLLADQEEREIEHLVASIIDNQMKKLYSKLEHFEELEMLLEKERLEVERARQLVYADRLRYAEAQTATAKSLFRNPAPS